MRDSGFCREGTVSFGRTLGTGLGSEHVLLLEDGAGDLLDDLKLAPGLVASLAGLEAAGPLAALEIGGGEAALQGELVEEAVILGAGEGEGESLSVALGLVARASEVTAEGHGFGIAGSELFDLLVGDGGGEGLGGALGDVARGTGGEADGVSYRVVSKQSRASIHASCGSSAACITYG